MLPAIWSEFFVFTNFILIFAGAAVNAIGAPHSELLIPDVICRETESQKPVSLVRALHTCFGFQFYSIGLLKLLADGAGFMGPLLLNKLVTFIETKSESVHDGYLYAAGLFAFTLIGGFLGKYCCLNAGLMDV
jgi:hypothetical protein